MSLSDARGASGDLRSVAVLGTGIMGGAMCRRAAAAGLRVTAWSRPIEHAEALLDGGVEVAETADRAVAGADLVVTMAPDAAAIRSFAEGPEGFLEAMPAHAIWMQCATVGVGPADELIALAERHGVTILDVPVLGSREPAQRGELVALASGEEAAIDRCLPFLSSISRRVMRLGPAGNGSRLKMVTNHWIMGAVAVLAETIALADGLGIGGRPFLDALDGTQMNMGYAQIKGAMMIERVYPSQGSLATGAKDAVLAHRAASDLGLPARVSEAAAELLTAALAQRSPGHDDDMAAAFEAAIRPAG